jgi:hypothetical protein
MSEPAEILLLLLLLLQPVHRPTVMIGHARPAAALPLCAATRHWQMAQTALMEQ